MRSAAFHKSLVLTYCLALAASAAFLAVVSSQPRHPLVADGSFTNPSQFLRFYSNDTQGFLTATTRNREHFRNLRQNDTGGYDAVTGTLTSAPFHAPSHISIPILGPLSQPASRKESVGI